MLDGIAPFWLWISAGLALLALEVAVGGNFLLWLGFAALATGGLVFFNPGLSWPTALVIFAVGAVVAALLGRRLVQTKGSEPADAPNLHRRGDALVGRVATVQYNETMEALVINLDDTMWRVEGEGIAAGMRVRITGLEGGKAIVAAV
jgi:inner membrane protein